MYVWISLVTLKGWLNGVIILLFCIIDSWIFINAPFVTKRINHFVICLNKSSIVPICLLTTIIIDDYF